MRYLIGDHGDLGQVIAAVAGADVLVHLAALVRGYPDPAIFHNNVTGTYNVHEAAYRLGIRRVVSTSSRSILGWTYRERDFLPAYFPIDEDHPGPAPGPLWSVEAGRRGDRALLHREGRHGDRRPAPVGRHVGRADARPAPQRRPSARRFDTCTYSDVRDVAAAYRLAVERPLPGHTVLWIVADDSIVGEPLCDLLPRLLPEIGDLARDLNWHHGVDHECPRQSAARLAAPPLLARPRVARRPSLTRVPHGQRGPPCAPSCYAAPADPAAPPVPHPTNGAYRRREPRSSRAGSLRLTASGAAPGGAARRPTCGSPAVASITAVPRRGGLLE